MAISYLVFQCSSSRVMASFSFSDSDAWRSEEGVGLRPGFFGSRAVMAPARASSMALYRVFGEAPKLRLSSFTVACPVIAISTTRYRSSALRSFHCIVIPPSSGAVLVDPIRYAQADHLPDAVADAYLDVLPLTSHPQIGPAQLPQEEKRGLGLLPQGDAQGVVLTALSHGLLDVGGQTVETVRRARTVDALVGALVVVELDPVVQAHRRIGEGGEDRLLQKLLPECLPEALDLAQGHRVVRGAPDVADPLCGVDHASNQRLRPGSPI